MKIGPLLRKVDPTELDPGERSIVMETPRGTVFLKASVNWTVLFPLVLQRRVTCRLDNGDIVYQAFSKNGDKHFECHYYRYLETLASRGNSDGNSHRSR